MPNFQSDLILPIVFSPFAFFCNITVITGIQRWSPGGVSGNKLLRTDRRSWSDEHGVGYQPKDSFELPSSHWQWESDWMVDSNVRDEMSVDRMVRGNSCMACGQKWNDSWLQCVQGR